MITEDYVSFETANLLKEKDFNEACEHQYYVINEKLGTYNTTDRSRNPERYIDAPTHQMAMAWLREKDIRICPDYSDVDGKWFTIIGTKKKRTYSGYYDTYEEAIEIALKYALENLL